MSDEKQVEKEQPKEKSTFDMTEDEWKAWKEKFELEAFLIWVFGGKK